MLSGVRTAVSGALLALAAAVCMVLYGPVSVASAHAELLASNPAAGATVAAPPAAVTLTFSDEIDPKFVRVAVTTPAGEATAPVTTSGPTVSIAVPGRGPGAYRVTYRVVSADGHPISGRLDYTVAGTPTSSAPASSSGTTDAASPSATVSPPASSAPTAEALGAAGPAADDTTSSSRTLIGALVAAAVMAALVLVGASRWRAGRR